MKLPLFPLIKSLCIDDEVLHYEKIQQQQRNDAA